MKKSIATLIAASVLSLGAAYAQDKPAEKPAEAKAAETKPADAAKPAKKHKKAKKAAEKKEDGAKHEEKKEEKK